MKIVLVAIALVVLAAIAYALYSGWQFSRHAETERVRLSTLQTDNPIDQDAIPELMRSFAIRNGGAFGGPKVVELTHEALLRMGPDQPFVAISARQALGTRTPSIVWTASGMVFAVVPISAIDSYLAGEGEFEVRLAGAVPVVRVGGESAATGELLRALSELPVHPDAILNMAGLSWREIDDRRVEVTADSAYGSASGIFVFDAAGDITGFEANRPDASGGEVVELPWRGVYGQYQQMGAYRIPTYGEAGWLRQDGLFVYWKGTIASYAPAPSP